MQGGCYAGAEGPREQPRVQEGSAKLQVLGTAVTPGKENLFAEQGRVVSRKEHPSCASAFTQPLPRLPARHTEGDPRCGGGGEGAVGAAGTQACPCVILPALQGCLSYRNRSLEQCHFELHKLNNVFYFQASHCSNSLPASFNAPDTDTQQWGSPPASTHTGQKLYQ